FHHCVAVFVDGWSGLAEKTSVQLSLINREPVVFDQRYTFADTLLLSLSCWVTAKQISSLFRHLGMIIKSDFTSSGWISVTSPVASVRTVTRLFVPGTIMRVSSGLSSK